MTDNNKQKIVTVDTNHINSMARAALIVGILAIVILAISWILVLIGGINALSMSLPAAVFNFFICVLGIGLTVISKATEKMKLRKIAIVINAVAAAGTVITIAIMVATVMRYADF